MLSATSVFAAKWQKEWTANDKAQRLLLEDAKIEIRLVKRFQPAGYYEFFLECDRDPTIPGFKEEVLCEEDQADLCMKFKTVWSKQIGRPSRHAV